MLLTKTEFCNEYEFNALSSVTQLIKNGNIVTTKDGYIDTNQKENKKWIAKRKNELKDKHAKEEKEQQNRQARGDAQLSLEIDLLNAKLDEKTKRNNLLDLKIKKETNAMVETSILNRVLIMIFDDFFKNLTEFPVNYASEIIDIVRAEKEPKEKLVEFMTDFIITNIKKSLDNTKKAAKKYYE